MTSSTGILEDIERIRTLLSDKPFPQSIWFIDRAAIYWRLRAALPAMQPTAPHMGYYAVQGMPIHRWASTEIRQRIFDLLKDEEWTIERARRVFPFCQSGIWVQMSNGRHRRLEITG